MNLISKLIAIFLLVIGTIGCSAFLGKPDLPLHKSDQYYNYIQPTFPDYLAITAKWLKDNRAYITQDHKKELMMNMPFQLEPEQRTNKAVLLVHGLGDSPFSFSDVAKILQKQGFYVQTLLLPGHGSKPEDLRLPNYSDWQQIVDHYAALLKKDYEEIWMGGFSTGGNLVTTHAIEKGGTKGLILFSPGFQSKTPILERLAPLASLFFGGYQAKEDNIARYTSAPLDGAISYIDSALKVRDLLVDNSVDIPTMIVMSEADSVVDMPEIANLFQTRFKHPNSQFILYGESQFEEPSFTSLTMHLDEQRISTGSHMSPLFSPYNGYYGKHGIHRMCMNSFNSESVARCREGKEVWFSAWGYEEPGKDYARLTWNPYFEELENSLVKLISSK